VLWDSRHGLRGGGFGCFFGFLGQGARFCEGRFGEEIVVLEVQVSGNSFRRRGWGGNDGKEKQRDFGVNYRTPLGELEYVRNGMRCCTIRTRDIWRTSC
jgi:hypothetical protein